MTTYVAVAPALRGKGWTVVGKASTKDDARTQGEQYLAKRGYLSMDSVRVGFVKKGDNPSRYIVGRKCPTL